MTQRIEHYGGAVPTTLSSSLSSTAVTFTIANTSGWPTGALGKFYVTIDAGSTSEERILCASRSGNIVTVDTSGRGVDGTSASAHSANAPVVHSFSATEADDANVHQLATTGVHGVAGALVGTSDTQTLTNKTLNSPTINSGTLTTPTIGDFTNATHAHTNAASGGLISKPVQVAFHIANSLTTGVKNPKFIANQAMTLRSARAILAAGSGATFQVYVNGVAPAGMTTSPSVGTTVVQHDFTDVVLAVGDYVQVNVISAGTTASELSITIDAVA